MGEGDHWITRSETRRGGFSLETPLQRCVGVVHFLSVGDQHCGVWVPQLTRLGGVLATLPSEFCVMGKG